MDGSAFAGTTDHQATGDNQQSTAQERQGVRGASADAAQAEGQAMGQLGLLQKKMRLGFVAEPHRIQRVTARLTERGSILRAQLLRAVRGTRTSISR
jgi:hypothetical protein